MSAVKAEFEFLGHGEAVRVSCFAAVLTVCAVKVEFESLGHGEAVRVSAAVFTVCAVKVEFSPWDMEKRCVSAQLFLLCVWGGVHLSA